MYPSQFVDLYKKVSSLKCVSFGLHQENIGAIVTFGCSYLVLNIKIMPITQILQIVNVLGSKSEKCFMGLLSITCIVPNAAKSIAKIQANNDPVLICPKMDPLV